MKKIFTYILLAGLCLGISSCDKFFDSMEGDLSKIAAEDLLASDNGLLALLANLYSSLPDMSMSAGDLNDMFASSSRSTPEYSASVDTKWNYGQIRAVHNFMDAVNSLAEQGRIDNATRDAYLGEARFVRASIYFANVRTHGGIPIVEKSLDNEYDGEENLGLYYPRKTEKESWDWVIAEFQAAADLLPETQAQEMRVNKYGALAMKARAALWAASESKYWDRAPLNTAYIARQKELTYMKKDYAPAYYEQAIAAAEAVIKCGQYELVGQDPASIAAATQNFIDLFQDYNVKEGILGRSYKTGSTDTGNGSAGWATHQVITGYQQGTYSVTLNLADEFDYYSDATARKRVDGTIQTLVNGDESTYFTEPQMQMTAAKVADYKHYDSVDEPFKLKDARFQAWVCYPGTTFRGKVINAEGGMVMQDGTVNVYPNNNNGVDFNGKTYYPYGGAGEDNSFFYRLNVDTNDSNRSFYCFTIRKGQEETGYNANPQTPWYNIRFSEMLLTYAEAVVESGKGNATDAKKYLNDVRRRAGFKDEVDLTLENVLHEWKVEFALENKWPMVLYRRRAYYNPSNTPTVEEGSVGKKLTLIPMVDLSGAKAQWIFLRAVPYQTQPSKGYSGVLQVYADDYYSAIPNYVYNRIENNNSLTE